MYLLLDFILSNDAVLVNKNCNLHIIYLKKKNQSAAFVAKFNSRCNISKQKLINGKKIIIVTRSSYQYIQSYTKEGDNESGWVGIRVGSGCQVLTDPGW